MNVPGLVVVFFAAFFTAFGAVCALALTDQMHFLDRWRCLWRDHELTIAWSVERQPTNRGMETAFAIRVICAHCPYRRDFKIYPDLRSPHKHFAPEL